MCWHLKIPRKTLKYVSSRSVDVPLMSYFNRHLSERRSSHFVLTLSEGGSTPVDGHALSTETVGPMRKLASVLGLVKNSLYATNLIPYSTRDCQDLQACRY